MTFRKTAFSAFSLLLLSAGILPAADKTDPPKPASHTVRKIEGWNVRIDDRLLRPPHEALGSVC